MAAARKVKIGEFRNRVSSFIRRAERGETISIMRRNREVALLLPPERRGTSKSLLGCLEGTARALGNIDESRIPKEEWFKGS